MVIFSAGGWGVTKIQNLNQSLDLFLLHTFGVTLGIKRSKFFMTNHTNHTEYNL